MYYRSKVGTSNVCAICVLTIAAMRVRRTKPNPSKVLMTLRVTACIEQQPQPRGLWTPYPLWRLPFPLLKTYRKYVCDPSVTYVLARLVRYAEKPTTLSDP